MLKGKLPSEVVVKRQQYLNSLKRFVEEQEKKLSEIVETLGWSEESLLKIPTKKVCPYNEDHIVPEDAFEKHVEKCKLLNAGYQKDELELFLQNTDFWYSHADSIMKVEIDENLLNKIIWDNCVQTGQVYTGHRTMPGSHIESNINLTPEDRLAVYRHVVQVSQEAGKVIPVDRTDELLTTDWSSLVKKGLLNEQSNKEFSSKLEQLAALRDMKRRRQSYRAKNVHITKKSYTEIIREVIVNQMEVLKPAEEEKSRQTESPEVEECDKRAGSSRHNSKDRDGKRDSRDRRGGSKARDWGRWGDNKDRHINRGDDYRDKDRYRRGDSRERYRGKRGDSRDRRRDRQDGSKESKSRDRPSSSKDGVRRGSSKDRQRDSRDRDLQRDRSPESSRRNRSLKSKVYDRSPLPSQDTYPERMTLKEEYIVPSDEVCHRNFQKETDGEEQEVRISSFSDIKWNLKIKQEVVSDDSENFEQRDMPITSKLGEDDKRRKGKRKKRSRSSSSFSESDQDDQGTHLATSSKRKKSKHKKKHSKKHKKKKS